MASTTETPAAPAAAAEPQKASEPTPAPAPATAPAPAPAPVAAASSAAPQNGHSEPARDRSPRRSRSPSRERERERERSRSASRDRSPRRERSVDRKASRSPSRRSRSRSPRRDRSPSRDKKSRDRSRSRSRSRSPRRSSERDHRGSSSSRSRYDDDRYRSDRRERDRRDDRDDRRYDDRRRDDRDDRRRSPPRSSASSVAAAAPARAAGPVPPAAAQSFGVVSGAFPYAAPVGYGNPYGAPQGGYGGGYGAASSSSSSARGPVAKNFYKPPASHANFTDDQVREWWRENRITLQGRGAELFKPCRTFDESNLAAEYLITTRTFPKPTPIQAQTWPVALSGRDMIGIAETGSGKTLAFVVPGCVHIRAQPPLSPAMPGPIVLILAPTRELACQTQEVCDAVGRGLGIRTVCLYGGVGKGSQRGALQRGVHIAVATPGRLLDLINEGRCNISRVTYLVLDEADRMLDMGFEKDIRAIIERLRPDRQTVMFSATWPVEIQRLAHEFLQDPIKVTIGSPDLAANRRITQVVEVLQSPDDRDDRLDACLRKYHASGQNRILIFVGMKREADRVDRMLRNRYRWRSQAIHGDLDQNERTRVLAQFKSGTAPLLVATDVAARGLDIPDVEYVINYTFPMNIEDYVHRIGRTGRGGKEGLAHTFLVPQDAGKARDLIDILRKANQQVPPELEDMSAYGRRGGGGRGGGGRGGGGGYGGGGGGGGGGRWPSGGGGGGGGGGHSSAHGGYGSQGGYRGPAAPAAPVAAAAPAAYGAPAAMPWAAYGQYAAYAPAAYAMPYGMPYGMPTSGGPGAPTAHK